MRSVKFDPLSSNQGYLVPMVVALVGVMAFIMMGVASWQSSTNRIKQAQKVKAAAESIRQNVLVQIYNNTSWAQTAGDNLCLLNGSECPEPANSGPAPLVQPTPKPLTLRNPEGEVFLNSKEIRDGFNLLGQRCKPDIDGGFTLEGNNACPFRYNLTWMPSDCSAGICSVKIIGELLYKPKSDALNVPLNLDMMKIDFVRGQETNSLQNACNSLGGSFDQTSLKCSVRDQQAISCPNGKVLKILVQGQVPECVSILPTQPACPQGQAVRGISSSGAIICAVK